jgi:hypothetical protein
VASAAAGGGRAFGPDQAAAVVWFVAEDGVIPIIDLDAFAAATRKASEGWGRVASNLEAAFEAALVEGSRQSRRRFLVCGGCPDCAEPLPVLAGDIE